MTSGQYEAVRIVADALKTARFGQTATGQPARIIPEADHAKAMGALIALLADDAGGFVDDPLPFVAWASGKDGFGAFHRQTVDDLTRCGIRVPVTHARTCYRPGSSPRPADSCAKCWADTPAIVEGAQT